MSSVHPFEDCLSLLKDLTAFTEGTVAAFWKSCDLNGISQSVQTQTADFPSI